MKTKKPITQNKELYSELGYSNKDNFLFLLEEYNRYLERNLPPQNKENN